MHITNIRITPFEPSHFCLFAKLPDDVTQIILQKLPAHTCLKIHLVCRKWFVLNKKHQFDKLRFALIALQQSFERDNIQSDSLRILVEKCHSERGIPYSAFNRETKNVLCELLAKQTSKFIKTFKTAHPFFDKEIVYKSYHIIPSKSIRNIEFPNATIDFTRTVETPSIYTIAHTLLKYRRKDCGRIIGQNKTIKQLRVIAFADYKISLNKLIKQCRIVDFDQEILKKCIEVFLENNQIQLLEILKFIHESITGMDRGIAFFMTVFKDMSFKFMFLPEEKKVISLCIIKLFSYYDFGENTKLHQQLFDTWIQINQATLNECFEFILSLNQDSDYILTLILHLIESRDDHFVELLLFNKEHMGSSQAISEAIYEHEAEIHLKAGREKEAIVMANQIKFVHDRERMLYRIKERFGIKPSDSLRHDPSTMPYYWQD